MIFLLNFSEHEFTCVEQWLEKHQKEYAQGMDMSLEDGKPYKELIRLKPMVEGSGVQAKRQELYKSGGAFATTFRPLLLDLLSQKLSAANITGIIINDCQRVRQEATNEKFLCNLLKRENPKCWVRCYTSNAREIARGG